MLRGNVETRLRKQREGIVDATVLAAAGLKRLNVSLDSLNSRRFETITRGGKLKDVLAGIDRAIESGLAPVKLNMVVMRGRNEDELLEFVRLAAPRLIVRFIDACRWPMSASGTATILCPRMKLRLLNRSILLSLTAYPAAGRRSIPGPGHQCSSQFISAHTEVLRSLQPSALNRTRQAPALSRS
jgi:cyclic pyranopterin phosphate synthase